MTNGPGSISGDQRRSPLWRPLWLGLATIALWSMAGPAAEAAQRTSQVVFNLNADLTQPAQFYNLPYPSDLRLNSQGQPDLRGFPMRDESLVVRRLKDIAGDRPGFPTTAAAYFRFTRPVAAQSANRLIPAQAEAPILLVDIDPDSPERGRLYPVVASTPRPDRYYVPDYLLAVAPYPGIVLPPGRTYAYVVRRPLRDQRGQLLTVNSVLRQLRVGRTPPGPLGPATQALYAPLWETLDQMGVRRQSVAAATVFTTGDVVAEMARLSDQVLQRYDVAIAGLQLDPSDGASHERFCELQGYAILPQFQRGLPPFFSQGLFAVDPQGRLVEQRRERVAIALTIPKAPMPPEGYPLMLYLHGSNGLSTQVVDRGAIATPGGEPAAGLGPAHVVAAYGFAAMGSALPLNPERFLPDVTDAYLNPFNLGAYRDTFRQGVIEQRLLIEALEQLAISPDVLAGCDGPSLPPGATQFRIQPQPVTVLGQSHGAQYAIMTGAVDPKIETVVPAGSGGFWPLLVSQNQLSPLLGLIVGTLQPLDHLYPGLRLLETAWEPVEPMVYGARLGYRPLPNHPARSIYQPVGQGDSEFPQAVFDAMALANSVQQAGSSRWPEMQQSLALDGLAGRVPYNVINNRQSIDGMPYTGVVVQYRGDGIADSHTIFSQLDTVKYQYGCFFESAQASGTAVLPSNRRLDRPCPSP